MYKKCDMPIYEYDCADCGARSEFLVGVTAEAITPACDSCGGTHLEKRLSAFGVVHSTPSYAAADCACGDPASCDACAPAGGCGCGGNCSCG